MSYQWLVSKCVVKDEVSVSKQSIENDGRLVNQSRVGPLRVEENSLHKMTSSFM